MVFRTYVEKRQGLAPECEALLTDCRDFLGVQGLRAARIWNRYDVEGIEAPLFENACRSVFSEPPLDLVSDAADTQDACAVFAVEPLPGQFDQRADSASQCIQLLSQGERPRIRTAKVYALYGTLSEKDVEAVKHHVINPVESREASLAKPETLEENLSEPKPVASVDGFTGMDESALSALLSSMGLAMDLDDLKTLQAYFRDEEHRDPTVTEVRVVDTYWSDHCRHTTFSTHLDEVSIEDPAVKDAYDRYLAAREEVYGIEKAAKRPQTLMDIATIGTKTLKKRGLLPELDESEEINACSVKINARHIFHNGNGLLLQITKCGRHRRSDITEPVFIEIAHRRPLQTFADLHALFRPEREAAKSSGIGRKIDKYNSPYNGNNHDAERNPDCAFRHNIAGKLLQDSCEHR